MKDGKLPDKVLEGGEPFLHGEAEPPHAEDVGEEAVPEHHPTSPNYTLFIRDKLQQNCITNMAMKPSNASQFFTSTNYEWNEEDLSEQQI